jgi:hypothetical protein
MAALEHSLEDFGELTAHERQLLHGYEIQSAESLYCRMTEGAPESIENFRSFLGRTEESFSALERKLHAYLLEKNPGFLKPRDHPDVGRGALPPPDKD